MPAPRKRKHTSASTHLTYNRDAPDHLLVDPRWLVKVFGSAVLAALICAYLLLCGLFYFESWQWVLHPTHTATAGTGLPGELIHFGPDATGNPQLTGEWIPATNAAKDAVLYLRPGDGQLDFADAPSIRMFGEEGMHVLAFDYRGFGRSATRPHPDQQRMQQDSEAAWNYLTSLRGVAANHVLVYGSGVGAALAVDLVAAHRDAAGLVLRNATPDVLGTIRDQKRSRFLPVTLLLHDRFDVTSLSSITTPKLLWDIASVPAAPETLARASVYRAAADPKMTVTLPQTNTSQERATLRRFLDERVSLLPPSSLQPDQTK